MVNTTYVIAVLVGSIALIGVMAYFMTADTTNPERVLEDEANNEFDGPYANDPDEAADGSTAVITTNHGSITIELFRQQMPVTTQNFVKLARSGFYDGVQFHRVMSTIIQGGDPNTKTNNTSTYGLGGPGYTIKDEFVEGEDLTNARGTIAMANTGAPNSGGSQFFINVTDNTSYDFDKEPLDSKHPVFGRVVEGMDVVDTISAVETNEDDLPQEPVVIESIEIVE